MSRAATDPGREPHAPAIDGDADLARLVAAEELDDLVAAVERALGVRLAISDRTGRRLAGLVEAHARTSGVGGGVGKVEAHEPAGEPRTVEGDATRRTIYHDGLRVGELAATGANAAEALDLAATALELIVHHANARDLAGGAHEQAMRLTFAELTEHNQRLSRAVARLEELDRLKSNFLATMSHELRTPLTSVIGYTEMMIEGLAGPVSDEQREYLTTILGKADQLLGLITSVLDVASLESGNLAVDRCALSLGELVANEVATFAAQAGRRGIAINLDTRGDSTVFGDRRKIRQIVSSLLSNAVKFTPDRGRVGVCVRPGPLSPHDGDCSPAIQLIVSDSGIGISRDQIAKIFEPFFQVDSSSTRAFGGTGLGLTLAKAYVEAHGGRIWVDTAPGKGSTFVATFPTVEARAG